MEEVTLKDGGAGSRGGTPGVHGGRAGRARGCGQAGGTSVFGSSQVDQLWDGGECDVRARRWMGSSAGVLVTAWTVEGHNGQERRFHGFPGF